MILQIIDRNPTKYSIQSPAREALSSWLFLQFAFHVI